MRSSVSDSRFALRSASALLALATFPLGCNDSSLPSGNASGGSSRGGATGGTPASGNTSSGGSTASGGTAALGGALGGGGASLGGARSTSGGAPSSAGGGAVAGSDDAGGEAGAGGDPSCDAHSQTRSSRSARSAGFVGAYQGDYYPLYSAACVTPADCARACEVAGGTLESCAASECIDSTPDYCLPPTYWFDLDQLLIEGNGIESSAWIIMVDNPYRDELRVTNFQFEIPAGATITGLRFSFNEAADSADSVGDYSVRALREGAAVGLDRGKPTPWATALRYVDYGGPGDAWGSSWSVADVNSSEFGVALTPMYLSTGGNARAYVDFVRATVYYSACD